MLKSVLTKLIECFNTCNEYVVQGPPHVASQYLQKCDLLIECLKDAGYTIKIAAKTVVVAEGLYRGHNGRVFTGVSVEVPESIHDDIAIFKELGFNWLSSSNVMTYKFDNVGEGTKAV